MEEVDDDGTSVGNGAYNTAGAVKDHYQKINKSEVDTYLNATDNNAVEEDNVNYKTQESSEGVNSETYIDNGVDGSFAYDQFKELFICNSLHQLNVCAIELMELFYLGKQDKGETDYAAKYKSRNEIWFNQKKKKPSKEEVTDGIEDIYIQCDGLIQVRGKRGSADTVEC